MAEPRYFGNKIRSVNLWFDVSSTILRVSIPLTSLFLSPEIEKMSVKAEGPEIACSSLLPNLQSSLSFFIYALEGSSYTVSASLYHLTSENVFTAQINIINYFNRLEGGYHNYPYFTDKINEARRS